MNQTRTLAGSGGPLGVIMPQEHIPCLAYRLGWAVAEVGLGLVSGLAGQGRTHECDHVLVTRLGRSGTDPAR